MFKKIKRAFKWHWNLLALGAGVALAFLSGHPDVVLPAVAALEFGYLGFIGTNPRFQNVLIGRKLLAETEEEEAERAAEVQRKIRLMLDFLPDEDDKRFLELRARCAKLMKLRRQMGSRDASDSEYRFVSLEKLLWLFLRLLHQRGTIREYLEQTDRPMLAEDADAARAELEAARAEGRSEQLQRSLSERLTAIEGRISNYDNAQENLDLLTAEIDKTEQKIAHICEVGMTSKSPVDLSSQIDTIAESVSLTQRTLAGIDLGGALDEEPDTEGALLGNDGTFGESESDSGPVSE